VLLIAWEVKSREEAIAAGRNPSLLVQNELWSEHLIEVQFDGESGGTIVWEWHAWDHLIQDFDASNAHYGVVAEHPELIDLNYTQSGPNSATHNQSNRVFRCTRYAPDYAAFNGKELTPGSPIEIYPTDIENKSLPTDFPLRNNPNPFNPVTTIHFFISQPGHVKLEVFNAIGQSIAVLVDGILSDGPHVVTWNVAHFYSGVYYSRLTTNYKTETKKITLVR